MSAERTARSNLARNLQTVRGYHGVSQKQLADAVGCDPAYVSHIEAENRAPSLQWLGRAADVLDVEVADLLSPVSLRFHHGGDQ